MSSDPVTKQKQYGFIDLLWDVRDTKLPVRGSAKQMLSALVTRCSGSTGLFTCYPSIQQLTDDTQLDRKTVLASIESLEETKLVSVIRDKKRGSKENAVNQYTINAGLIRSLKAKQQHPEVTTDDLEDQYLAAFHLREGVDAVVADMDRRLDETWTKLWAKLLVDARESLSSGGLDAVRFPGYVDSDPIFHLTKNAMHYPGANPEFFIPKFGMPVDIPKGHEIKGVRVEDGSWRLRIVPMHCYRHLSPTEIAAEFRREEEEAQRVHAQDEAEYHAEKLLVDKIGVDAYRAWLRVAFWDEEYDESIAPGKSKDEVIALLRAENPLWPGLSTTQPEWGHTLDAVYREQALAGVRPPDWAFK